MVAPFEILGLEPAQAGHIFLRMDVAETLVSFDRQGQAVPALAQGWTLSDDRKVWRFTLRDKARFHDETPVTAEAVVTSLERSRGKGGVLNQVALDSISAEDGTVVIRTREPFAPLPAFLANYSSIILAPSSLDAAGNVTRIVATGPYRVSRLAPPLSLETERSPSWSGPAPAFTRASYLSVAQGESRATMAESGEADLAFTLPPTAMRRLAGNPRIALRSEPVPRTRIMLVNSGDPLLSDPRARRALSLAVDRAGMAAGILRNPAAAATQLLPPVLAGWHDPSLPPLAHDPAEARRLLAELGWRPGADGILVRDGRRFRLSLRTVTVFPELPIMATAIQAQLREVGIEVDVQAVGGAEIPAAHADGSLQLALAARNYALVPEPLGVLQEDFGPKGGVWGAMGWSSPALLDAFRKPSTTFEPAEREAPRRLVTRILQEELPVIPLSWLDYNFAVSQRVTDVRFDPYELSYGLRDIRPAR
ncbi:ABC transporter substrate-binding protein [Teichococcus aestuarii]|uniref:ABC transporter substrate-binding protein n=2 Tax=Teichococcus aestuarii TaxID=568898 RepID=UPI003622C786